MAVDLERERARVMPELVLHVGQRLAHVYEQTRVGVPKGVRLAVAQFGPEVIMEDATRGLVITESTFTRNALQEIAAYKFRMEGADGQRINRWLDELRAQP